MKSLYERLPSLNSSDDAQPLLQHRPEFEFIPLDWLIRYFTNPSNPSPIDTSASMCVHGNLDLNKIQDVKAVDVKAAEELFKEIKSQTLPKRLTLDSLCEMCVRNRCRTMKLASSMCRDHKIITDLLKQPLPSPGM